MELPLFCFLPNRTLLAIRGSEASEFLQRLITNNVAHLAEGHTLFSALLTPQGKVLFDFFLQRQSATSFIIDLHKPFLENFIEKLNQYKLGSQFTLEPLPGRVGVCFSHPDYYQAIFELSPEDVLVFPDPRCDQLGMRLWIKNETILLKETTNLEVWQRHRWQLGIGEIGTDFPSGSLSPFQINLDWLHGLDATKGCFIGQEVVARMRHRHMVRKRFLPCQIENGSTKLMEVTIPPWLLPLRG